MKIYSFLHQNFYCSYLNILPLHIPDNLDFGAINSSNNPLVTFTSDDSTHRQCFNVTITDDEKLEDIEQFTLNLTLAAITGREVNISIDPSVSVVEIIDEDGELLFRTNNFRCYFCLLK